MLYVDAIDRFSETFPGFDGYQYPWELTGNAEKAIAEVVAEEMLADAEDYHVNREMATAIHKSAKIDPTAKIMGATIIGERAIIGPGAFLRGGVYVAARAVIGFSSEVKTSFVGPDSMISHLNFVGDSLIGSGVTLEVGAHIANCGKESPTVKIVHDGQIIDTRQAKFGAVVGDGVSMGANAVLREGTLLPKGSVIPRLTYVDQLRDAWVGY